MKGVAHAFILSAAQFWHSARLSNEVKTRELALFYPVGHNLGMACELALKAYLLDRGIAPKTLRQKALGHNLDALLKRAIQEGLEITQAEADAIVIVNTTHQHHFFRYGWVGDEGQITGVRAMPDLDACTREAGKLVDRISGDRTVLRKDFVSLGFEWPVPLPVLLPVKAGEIDAKVQEVRRREQQWRDIVARGQAQVYYPPGQG